MFHLPLGYSHAGLPFTMRFSRRASKTCSFQINKIKQLQWGLTIPLKSEDKKGELIQLPASQCCNTYHDNTQVESSVHSG